MAQSVLNDAYVGYTSQLAIFDKIRQDVSIKRSQIVKYYPINDYSAQGVLQFAINNSSTRYMDLRGTRLNLTCKLVGPEGQDIYPTGPVVEEKKRTKRSSDADRRAAALASAIRSGVTDNAGKSTAPVDGAEGGSDIDIDDSSDAADDQEAGEFIDSVPEDALRANIGVVNNIAHSLWSRVDISMQSKNLTQSDQSYAYMSYLKSLLYTNSDMKKSAMQASLFYPDRSAEVYDTNPVSTNNEGLKIRSSYFVGGQLVELSTPLHSDLFSVNRFIPGGINMALTLHQNNPQFYLMTKDLKKKVEGCRIIVVRASLDVLLHEIDPSIVIAHSEILKTQPAVFPYLRTELKRCSISSGLYEYRLDDPFSNLIPSELVIGLVRDSASHGDFHENGLHFEHCNLSSIDVTVDNTDMINSPISLKYDSGALGRGLQGYMTLTGASGEEGVNPIGTRLDYTLGNCLYRFRSQPLENMVSHQSQLPLRLTGNLRVSLRFDKAIEAPLTMVLFASFPGALKIDNFRNLYTI